MERKVKKDPHLLEELGHLAHEARVALHLALVPVGQEEVAQQRRVRQRLDDAVHEAGVAQVDQTAQACKPTALVINKKIILTHAQESLAKSMKTSDFSTSSPVRTINLHVSLGCYGFHVKRFQFQ